MKKFEFIEVVQFLMSLLLKLFFAIFITFFFALAIFILYFAGREGEINRQIKSFAENELANTLNANIALEGSRFEFKNFKVSFFADSLKVKKLDRDLEFKIEDFSANFNYYKIIFGKLEIETNVQKIYINSNIGSKPSLKLKFDVNEVLKRYYILYIRYFNFFVDNAVLHINNQNIELKNLELRLANQDFEQLNAKIDGKGSLLQKAQNGYLETICKVQQDTLSCKLNIFDLEEESIITFNKIFKSKKIEEFFKYKSGSLQNLELDFKFKEKLEYVNASVDFEKLIFFSQFLIPNRALNINNGVFRVEYKDEKMKIFFKFLADEVKNIFGEADFNFQNNELVLDVSGKNLKSSDIALYWPKNYLTQVSSWLNKSIYGANVPEVYVHVKTPVKIKEDLLVDISFNNAGLRYSSFLPDVNSAKGIVTIENDDNVVILVESAKSKEIEVQKGKAIFNTHTNRLFLDLNLTGKFADFINFFIPKEEVNSILLKDFKGNSKIKLIFETSVSKDEAKIFTKSNFNAKIAVEDFETPIVLNQNSVSEFEVNKLSGKNYAEVKLVSTPSNLYLNGGCKPLLSNASFNLFIDLARGDIGIERINLKGADTLLKGEVWANFKNPSFISNTGFETVKLCNNSDFAFFLNPISKSFTITGKKLDYKEVSELPVISFVNQFYKSQETEENFGNNINDKLEYTGTIKLSSLTLLNEVSIEKLDSNYFSKDEFYIQSNLIEGYKNSEALYFKVQDLGMLIEGFNSSNPYIPATLKNGELEVKAKTKDSGMTGDIVLKNYQLKLEKIDLSSKKLTAKFKTDPQFITILNLRLSNTFNAVALNGTIDRKTFELNMEALYTPVGLDLNRVLQIVPYASDAVNLLTFDRLKNGLIALNYEVKGTIIKPKVEFKILRSLPVFRF